MKKKILGLFMVLVLLFSGVLLSNNVSAKSRKANMIDICPTEKTLVKKNVQVTFYTHYFKDIKRYVVGYAFVPNSASVSGSFGLGFGPFSITISSGASGGGAWLIDADKKRLSTVKLNEKGDIYRYTNRQCVMTKEMKVKQEWATVFYHKK